MGKPLIFSCFLSMSTLLFLVPVPVVAGAFDAFAGNWRGTGNVVLKDGRREKVECKIGSITQLSGTRAYQKVKCKSNSKKINVRIYLSSNASSIAGNWSASGAVEGNVSGRIKGGVMNVQLTGHRLFASLRVRTSRCRQKMSLSGKIGKIRKIAVLLKKDC